MEPVAQSTSPRDVEQQWPTIADGVRELLLFVLSSLMVAEERITDEVLGARGRARQRGGGDVPSEPAGQ